MLWQPFCSLKSDAGALASLYHSTDKYSVVSGVHPPDTMTFLLFLKRDAGALASLQHSIDKYSESGGLLCQTVSSLGLRWTV